MNKQQFENEYCKKSNITLEEYNKDFITLPCNCGECEGWAAVNNDELSIKTHMNLYVKEVKE